MPIVNEMSGGKAHRIAWKLKWKNRHFVKKEEEEVGGKKTLLKARDLKEIFNRIAIANDKSKWNYRYLPPHSLQLSMRKPCERTFSSENVEWKVWVWAEKFWSEEKFILL